MKYTRASHQLNFTEDLLLRMSHVQAAGCVV